MAVDVVVVAAAVDAVVLVVPPCFVALGFDRSSTAVTVVVTV